MRAFDWLLKTVMLALAGLVTLAILGAIDAASTRSGPGGFLVERIGDPAPAPEPSPRPAAEGESDRGGGTGEEAAAAGVTAVAAGRAEPPGRWLEAIAYALLAVAGLLAIALLLLWSAVRDVRRIADSLSERPR